MPSLGEIAYRQRRALGDRRLRAIRQTADVCSFVWCWASSTRRLDRHPTQEEFASEWGVSERTVRNELARFRETYPGVELNEMVDWLNAYAANLQSQWEAQSLPALDSWAVAA